MYKNFGELICDMAKKYCDKPAFIIKNKEAGKVTYTNISYIKLEQDVRAFAKAIELKGLSGKRIAVIGKNCYQWMVAMLGTVYSGSASVPLDRALTQPEILEQTERIEADAFVFGPEYAETAALKDTVNICLEPLEGYDDVDEMVKAGYEAGLAENNCVDSKEASFYLFTSGTTSKSKIVMLCQHNILSNIDDMSKVEDLRKTDVNLALLPFHHTFGMIGTLMLLSVGATNVFCEGLRVQKALCEYKVTVLIAVPLILDSMKKITQKTIKKEKLNFAFSLLGAANKVARAVGLDLRRKIYKPLLEKFGGELRLIISGAAPLSTETAKFFIDKGIDVIQGYGLTETAPVVAAESWQFRRAGSVGKAMPSDDIKIVNKNDDGTGEIAVKGPNVMLGYYQNEEMTNEVMKDGYFHTGDVGYLDKDGYLFITGRIKNVIVLENGKKVYPEEVEFHIGKLDYVKEVVVLNEKQGKKDKVTAIVVADVENYSLEEAKEAFDKDINKINKRLAKHKQIQDYRVTDAEFDKTSTGKVKRY